MFSKIAFGSLLGFLLLNWTEAGRIKREDVHQELLNNGININNRLDPKVMLAANKSGVFVDHGRGSIGGYVNFLCPANESTVVNGQCNSDCIHNHGSVGGYCKSLKEEGEFNCYCGKRNYELQKESLQCQEAINGFREVCRIDCICNHAATSGSCDFLHHACICHDSGKNPRNIGCPYDSWKKFQIAMHHLVGHKGFRWADDVYHWFTAEDRPFPKELN